MLKIGVVLGCKPSSFSKDSHYSIEIRYFDAIEKAGAIAVPITYSHIEQQLQDIDGILLPGGDFNTPAHYYVENKDNPYEDEGTWFNAFMGIGKYALDNNIPILGICGGMQVLAILLGGKLGMLGHEDHRNEDNKKLAHDVLVNPDTLLHKITNKRVIKVNSIHREHVAKVNDDIVISGYSEDNIIEAIESKNHKFALGVQWHPECLVDNKQVSEQLELFKYFLKQCNK